MVRLGHGMELVADFSEVEQGASSRRIKNRSKACLHCRRRKMRCDGVKPSCFQCVRAERANECEYDDGITKTSTQLLYERLAMLEKRYRDLQASKRPSQNRIVPSVSRSNRGPASMAKSSNASIIRSNSAPERVYSQPRVNGNAVREQSFSEVFTGAHDASRTFGSSASVPGFIDDNSHGQSFDLISSTISSQSSSRSGRSTPSTSDFSHNDSAFHPKYAFACDIQQGSSSMSPYSQPCTDLAIDSTTCRETSVLVPGVQHAAEDMRIPRNISSLNSVFDLSPALREHLIDNFVAHSQQAGMTLLCNRLNGVLDTASSVVSPGAACVIGSFFLWGARFSNLEYVRGLQEHFLHEVLSLLPSLLSNPLDVPPELAELRNIDPVADGRYNIVIVISVSTMLATYFFSEGRTLEGSYHANNANRLAICAGLHHTPDPRFWRNSKEWTVNGFRDIPPDPELLAASRCSADLLPLPNNISTALERQHIFWNMFVIDRAWSAAGQLPGSQAGVESNVSLHDNHLRTSTTAPWPEDWGLILIDDFQEERFACPVAPIKSPLEQFLRGEDSYATHSILQLRAKSTALFEATSRVAFVMDPSHDASFLALRSTLQNFRETLPPISASDYRPPSYAMSARYTIHTLVHAASIHLYSQLAENAYRSGLVDDPNVLFVRSGGSSETSVQQVMDGLLGYERMFTAHSTGTPNGDLYRSEASPGGFVCMAVAAVDQCLFSAREIIRIASCIASDDYPFLEPIIAPCWSLASEVLLRELKRATHAHQACDKANLLSEIHVLETSLKYLGGVFPIGNIEARKLTSSIESFAGHGA